MTDHPCLPMVLLSAGSGSFLRLNRTFRDSTGLEEEELRGLDLAAWIHPLDLPALEDRIREGRGAAAARVRGAGGDWLAFDWQVRTHHGEPVLLGRGRSPEVEEARPALRRSEGLGRILDAMARVVERKNPGMMCSILLVDAERERITVGAGPSLPDEYNAAVEGLQMGPTVGSCGTAAFWNVPVVVEDIGADPLWCELREAADLAGVAACWSHPIPATDGSVLGAMALYQRVPGPPARHQMDGLEIAARMVGLAIERERLEEQLRDSAKMEALGALAGGVAHDFNNLLAVVLGNAELAASLLPAGSSAEPMLKAIVSATGSATDLANQMLAYAGRGALAPEQVELNGLVEDLVRLMAVTLSRKATLSFDLLSAPLGVRADRSQLRQVVMNLITNASEALGNEEGRILVRTRLEDYSARELATHFPRATLEPGEYAVLEVVDTGVGMDPAVRRRIFDPFFSTKPTGRGLGLAAVRGIVEGHRGGIEADSTPGAGTTFRVALPRIPLEGCTIAEKEVAAPCCSPARILVVDDEPHVRKVLATILEHAGYSVLQAADGQQAIDVFREDGATIDLVLLDLSMPRLGGDEVFRAMRALRPDVRVVLSSGFTEQQVLDRFQDEGLAGVVQKPARMDALLRVISHALENRSGASA